MSGHRTFTTASVDAYAYFVRTGRAMERILPDAEPLARRSRRAPQRSA